MHMRRKIVLDDRLLLDTRLEVESVALDVEGNVGPERGGLRVVHDECSVERAVDGTVRGVARRAIRAAMKVDWIASEHICLAHVVELDACYARRATHHEVAAKASEVGTRAGHLIEASQE